MRFYGLAITARALSLLQGHKRDMQSSHEYVLLPYTRAPHLRRIYRTLMHNALRDDGKYGYITRQRPMLFSLASHWLMLIRNQRSHKRSQRRRPTFIKVNFTIIAVIRRRLKRRATEWLMAATADLEKSIS